ncbi:TPA: prepilin peptidase [candidate division CPR2 bacterium]|uniref:Prepilin leader peptidase/N-methyltransferase n=1 Tax=candidate division CPR2 bacterium GW2011_GWC1_41_48 TaxID=1618344 RepID=A0A0G0WB72_UNCC2|nr:MAG: Type 4 prepilin-like protein leader peptide-processing enzyme [candidate division CPR2 bacterium GW2011_GWC2_39_35]KKR29067.1 MAG: Type 4 prepilin-like protein leader peptide-processing enzyme [candidate division CPR2 bacterium GW2011_GWD2_39_7]KKS09317.1 MAG: Type 4 prepilin-like protein leader peptide-processing enzyme [candidate division CPR2 bacterium GW2011_GWC1_41_48]OGB70555.1 MAG: hypothetical protein A2Y26_04410 [candidate division CPR2 bacterium GWD2_39_7]HBG82073.1 prepilin p
MIIFAITFGLITGSFLNAYEYRKRTKTKNVWHGRSFCPKCKHKLGAMDLFPVLSYLLLQGRCRYCKKPISTQYPIVEMVAAALFGLIYWHFFPSNLLNPIDFSSQDILLKSLGTLAWFYFASVLILVVISDLKEMIIPDEVVLPAIVVAFIYGLIASTLGGLESGYLVSRLGMQLIAGIVGSGFFYSMIVVSKGKWMGGGDVKLAAFMGFALGWPLIFIALLLAFILGSIFGIAIIVLRQKKFADAIPFGPFLAAGTVLAILWGNVVLTWYLDKLILL